MKKIKVLEALDAYYPTLDGPTLLVTNYAKSSLKRTDMSVEIMVPSYPKYKDEQPFPVHRIPSVKAPENNRCAAPMLTRKAKKIISRKVDAFDIIHVHSPFTLGKYVVKIGKKNHIPTAITLHTRYHEDFDRILKFKFLRKFMMRYIMKAINNADYVFTVSDGTVNTLRDYGYTGEVTVIRNGTDLMYPDNAAELIKKVNDLQNLDVNETVFLSVGRIVSNKKLDLAINALKIVKDKGYRFKFLIVGSGSYENDLKKLVEKLDLKNEVVFTGKVMDRQLLSAYFLRSDLFLFPSTFDTASLAPIEAAAMKLPTLMVKGCSTAEILTDGRNGYLAEENAQAWADKIISILDNRKDLSSMKELTYKEVYKTWDQVVEEIHAKYEWIIADYKEKNKIK